MNVSTVLLLTLLSQAPEAPPLAKPVYQEIAITERDVQAAVKVVFAKRAGTLISAERHISGDNMRLCVLMNRSSSSSSRAGRVARRQEEKIGDRHLVEGFVRSFDSAQMMVMLERLERLIARTRGSNSKCLACGCP